MSTSYGGAYGTLYGAKLAGYSVQAGDVVTGLGGGIPLTVNADGLTGTATMGGQLTAQTGLKLPETGDLLTSASGAAFFTAAISGGGSIASTAITGGAAWNPSDGPYSVTYSTATDWAATNGASEQIASGTGTAVGFRGISITVTSPTTGTTLTITPTWG